MPSRRASSIVALGAAALLAAPGAAAAQQALWTPSVFLELRPDGAALTAITSVPSSCDVADGTEDGFPEGVVGTPETLALQLKVHREPRKCTQALTYVAHRRDKLSLDGKTSLTVYVVRDGEVMGETSVTVTPPAEKKAPAAKGAKGASVRLASATGGISLDVQQSCGSTCQTAANIACGACAITCAVGKAARCLPGRATCAGTLCTCQLQPICRCE